MLRTLALPAILALGTSLVTGCARQDAADRSVEKLKADIAKLQVDRDRLDERVGVLETAEQQRDPASSRVRAEARSETPRGLRVVHLGEGETMPPPPEDSEPTDAVGADGPRQVVQSMGTAPSGRRRRTGSRETSTVSSVSSPEAKKGYDTALALVRSKQYDQALDALTSFLVRFPDHPYAENATYWRGECFYAKADYGRAAEQFEGVIARFPFGNKASDAMLKLGLCQQRLGALDQASKTFAELSERYPKSDAARQIPRP